MTGVMKHIYVIETRGSEIHVHDGAAWVPDSFKDREDAFYKAYTLSVNSGLRVMCQGLALQSRWTEWLELHAPMDDRDQILQAVASNAVTAYCARQGQGSSAHDLTYSTRAGIARAVLAAVRLAGGTVIGDLHVPAHMEIKTE